MSREAGPSEGAPRFPGADAAATARHWDRATAATVLSRLSSPAALAFFRPHEEAIASSMLGLLLDDHGGRLAAVVALIDNRLARGETDGWHYADMPTDSQTWRESLAHLDADAIDAFGTAFPECTAGERVAMLDKIRSAAGAWRGLPANRVWQLWMRYATTAYYAHPSGWDEIGFPGPAYPRGYKNLGINAREGSEVADVAPSLDLARSRP